MKNLNQISSKQIKALVVSTVVGVGILTLPNSISLIMGNDGWIPIILGGLLTVPFIIIINKIFQLYPNKDIFQIGREVLGKWVFNIFLIVLLFDCILVCASVVRNLAEMIKAFLLLTTPIEIIMLTFIIATSYIARLDIQMISRAGYHIYPIVIGFTILLTLVSLADVDFTNMLPVFQSSIEQLPKGIQTTFFSYMGFEILLFVLPFAEEREKTLKSSLMGIALVILVYTVIFIISLSQYGLSHLQRQTFPTISLMKEIDLPGFFIENLDGLVVAIWVIIVFGSIAPFYYAGGQVLSKLCSTKSQDLFILPLLPFIYIIALMPRNIIELSSQLGKVLNYAGVFSGILMPIIIYCIGYYKTRRRA